MFKYKVTFWYYTDNRDEWLGEADHPASAIILAMHSNKEFYNWVGRNGFKITVELTKE